MKAIARQVVLLVVATALSWWLFLVPRSEDESPRTPTAETLSIGLTPILQLQDGPRVESQARSTSSDAGTPAASAPSQPAPPDLGPVAPAEPAGKEELAPAEPVPADPEAASEPVAGAPSPPELGTPEGTQENGALPSQSPAASAAAAPRPASRTANDLMIDTELLATASKEISEEVPRGFITVMLAAPEDQLDIARFFGEELVLVPRHVLDPKAERPVYFRIASDGAPGVDRVEGRPTLERFRQYRDLFDYEYGRLPELLRELRRTVLSRSEIYLFAALIPAREWAVVVGRRSELLALAGRDLSHVARFVIRYVRQPSGGFDVRVEEIVFADGTRFRQPDAPVSAGSR